jgi:hypothetical protein
MDKYSIKSKLKYGPLGNVRVEMASIMMNFFLASMVKYSIKVN